MIEELDKQIQEKLAAYHKQVELAWTVLGIGTMQQPAFSPKSEWTSPSIGAIGLHSMT